ncbi:hypothetical protein GCM10009790_02580 [Georgenia ruanii]
MIGMLVTALCAVGVLVLVAVERRPEGGWVAWVRGSVQAWRSDELAAAKLRPTAPVARDTPIEDLFTLGETAEPAYTRPEELRSRFELAREQARLLRR